MQFYGREHETALLRRYQKISRTGPSQMVVVAGRRSVGKTHLIQEALNEPSGRAPFLYFFVHRDKTEKGNIDAFLRLHADALGMADLPVTFPDLRSLVEFILQRSKTQPMTLVIDEFQNLKTVSPAVFGDLQELWDRYAVQARLLLVTAGSDARTMREITHNPKAPLYGRLSIFIRLQPLPLVVLRQILEDHSHGCATADDHLALWMLTGGVAKYVERLMDAGCVTKEAMIEYAASPSSCFWTEGELLLKAVFKRDVATYFAVLEAVSQGVSERAKLTALFQKEIDISGHLKKLEEHFSLLTRQKPFDAGAKGRHFRLLVDDVFLRFWFRYLFANRSLLELGPGGSKQLAHAILTDFPEYAAESLKEYFMRELMENGTVSMCAPWWNRKGGDEIDIVAYQPFAKRLLFIEVKQDPRKIDLRKLKEKSFAFLAANPAYSNCEIAWEGRSLDDIKRSSQAD